MKHPPSVTDHIQGLGIPFQSMERPHPVTAFLETKPASWRAKYKLEVNERILRASIEHHRELKRAYKAALRSDRPSLQVVR